MNWMEEGVMDINLFLGELELNKAEEERVRIQHLKERVENLKIKSERMEYQEFSELGVWSTTYREDRTIKAFRRKMTGYTPVTNMQKKVLYFARSTERGQGVTPKKYVILGGYQTSAKREIDSYIDHSKYWRRRSVEFKSAEGTDIKYVFAENKEMMAIICFYKDRFIITSDSSFENILREFEGKPLVVKDQWNTPDAVDQILEIL